MRRKGNGRVARRDAWSALASAATLVAAAISGAARGADLTSTWVAAASGAWGEPARWSTPAFPNNGPQTYAVVIGAAGSPYVVTLDRAVTVNDFALVSPQAIVDFSAGTFGVVASPWNVSAGTFHLAGGMISGGSIDLSGSGTMTFSAGNNNRIANGALLNGGVNLSTAGARVRFQSFANFRGNATLSSSNNLLSYEYAATVNNQTLHLGGSDANVSVEGASTLSIGSTGVIRGRGTIGGQFFGMAANAVVNSGRIAADAMGGALNVVPTKFVNNGTLDASVGTLNITSSDWSTTFFGALRVGGAGVVNLGGAFTGENLTGRVFRSGGTINITGTVNNIGNLLELNDTTGEFRLDGGVINDGTITQSGNGRLGFSAHENNRLANNATLDGDLVLDQPGGRVRLLSGANFIGNATLSATNNVLAYGDSAAADAQTIHLAGDGAAVTVADGRTLTIGASAVIRGRGLAGNPSLTLPNTLVNGGLISADAPGATLSVHPSSLVNDGVLEALNAASLSIRNVNNPTGRFRALAGGRVTAANLSGNVNESVVDGPGSLLELDGASYTINRNVTLTDGAVLYLRGGWVTSATMTVDAAAVFDYASAGPSPLADLRARIISGFAAGAWNGPGINSTEAAAAAATLAVGYAETSSLFPGGGTFAGQLVDASAVLVALTRIGDADLNFVVNLADFNRLAANFGQSERLWQDGDFDYNGTVNLADFNKLAANFGASASGPTVTPADWANLASASPEPACAATVSAAMLMLASAARVRKRR